MGKTYGYMRVSTSGDSQRFDRQEAGIGEVDVLYQDRLSGGKRERPELNKMLSILEAGDEVVILSIDRLSRSTKDLLEIVESIRDKGASLRSIQDTWLDTSSENPMSDFLLTIMGALAEMERKQIVQRVNEGIQQAKSRGEELGRPKVSRHKVEIALELYDKGEHTVKQITEIAGIGRATLYRKIKEREEVS